MMAVVGAIGFAATAVGTLAMSVLAGLLLLKATLRALEAAVPRDEAMASVADFSEFARRSTGPLVAAPIELERAA